MQSSVTPWVRPVPVYLDLALIRTLQATAASLVDIARTVISGDQTPPSTTVPYSNQASLVSGSRHELPSQLRPLKPSREYTHLIPVLICSAWSGASYYFQSSSLTVQVYQALIDRGWRRSGTVFYKPDVFRHCCPHYTIRLPVSTFQPSRNQRRAINKWNDHVLGERYVKEASRLYPISKAEKARLRCAFDFPREIHKAEYEHVNRPPEPARRFEVALEPAEFSLEKYNLFHNYQTSVHKEKDHQISQSGFKRFLCDSPLQQTSKEVNGKNQLLGSFHQCYRVDGRLIAMGVLDLLPQCVSGVYFLYHADFERWEFGKLSALQEAALALEGGYQYYYMGYYIHSCIKMKYKGDYKTQYVLDPESYQWNPLDDELRNRLDKQPYVSLSREKQLEAATASPADGRGKIDEGECIQTDHSGYLKLTAAEAGAAVSEGMSLFDLEVPGLMTVEEIEERLDIGSIPVQVGQVMARAKDIVTWEEGDLKRPRSIKGVVGELVACMGPEAAGQVVIKFS